MQKYGLKSVETNSLQLKEDAETLAVPAVITREGVYDYDGIRIYEPADEVEKAAFTALNAWVVEEHPPEVILSKPQLIRGTVRNAWFEKDRIKAELVFFKNRCSPQYLEDIRTGKARSVSIGFFFECVPRAGEWNGQHYDYVKRDILIDHVAVGSWQGRCSYPLCGVGVDTVEGDTVAEKQKEAGEGEKLPEALPESFEKPLEGCESADSLINKACILIKQLKAAV